MRLPLLLAIAIAVTGCTDVTFPEPMPLKRKDLTAFPSRWQGTWKDDKGETFIITPNTLTSTGDGETLTIGETLRLRRFWDGLVLNKKQEDSGRWEVFFLRRSGSSITVHGFVADEGPIGVWKDVLGEACVAGNSGTGEQKTYILAPENNAAFRKLVLKGGTVPMTTVYRVE